MLALCLVLTILPLNALATDEPPVETETGAELQEEKSTTPENPTSITPTEVITDGQTEAPDSGGAGEPVTLATTSGTCGDNLTWKLENGTLTISGTGEMTDYIIENSGTSSQHVTTPWADNEITTVILPNGLTSIGDYAFWFCNLTKITIPNSVVSIGKSAFGACFDLTSIDFVPGSNLASIGENAFSTCQHLTNMVIPDGVMSIGAYAFSYCLSLKSVAIPKSVTEIENDVFNRCESLKDIYYGGSINEWNSINKATNAWLENIEITIHYTDGDIKEENTEITEHNVNFYPWLLDNSSTSDLSTFVSLGIDWGWNLFEQPSTTYDNRFTMAGLALSAAAENSQGSAEHMLSKLGFNSRDPHSENYNQPWYQIAQPGVSFGYKRVTNDQGEEEHIFAIVIRGTSNVADILTDASSILGGFSLSAEFTHTLLRSYILSCGLRPDNIKDNVKFFVTGHSLGGAVANITAQKLSDEFGANKVFAYTFATPSCITTGQYNSTNKADNIFNFLNSEDAVPNLTTSMQKRYGIDFWISRHYAEPAIYENFKNLTNGKDLKATMETWWPLKDAYFNKLLYAHSVDFYMSCLIGSKKESFAKVYITEISVLCPVDIEVYVSNGTTNNLLVGRVENNVVDEDASSGAYIYVDGDKKYIRLPYEGDYTIKLIGTDIGTMEYTVRGINLNTGSIIAEKSYKNVTLTNGKQMSSVVSVWNKNDDTINAESKIDTPEVPLYVLDDGGNIIKKVLPDDKGTEVPIKSNTDNHDNGGISSKPNGIGTSDINTTSSPDNKAENSSPNIDQKNKSPNTGDTAYFLELSILSSLCLSILALLRHRKFNNFR